ncbi:VanW family protein [Arcanobacterium pinnipediorum]|uniref:VanW family protein n=1 Tax=Arcanobacterium pinnipediorum TaxID=1503041 RepID=A0ABY5AGL2_9ACTO|nr:VanW family protein [Arcanobacterium pinnipediorum]USR79135.1 VanW family protein [Arcanobacterium pinnipediorum]
MQRKLALTSPRVFLPGLGVLFIVLYLGIAYSLSGYIPNNTKISGVDVSGLTQDQARDKLSSQLEPLLAQPRSVAIREIDSEAMSIDPAPLSLSIDYEATLGKYTGFSLNPVRLWRDIVGGNNDKAIVQVSQPALDQALTALAEQTAQAATDATISLTGTQVDIVESRTGLQLDTESAGDILLDQWLSGTDVIVLPSVKQAPQLTTEDAQNFARDLLTPLVDQPISLDVKEHHIEVSGPELADLLTVENRSDAFAIVVNNDKLNALIEANLPGVLPQARDASVTIENSAVHIQPSQDGEGVDLGEFTKRLTAVVETKNRTVVVPIQAVKAQLSTTDVESLGIKEVVSEISTPLTADQVRTTNLIVGSRYVTNTLVRPGETFDLQTALGPLEESRGFVSSGVLVDGFPSTALGGGLSQLATNVFNVGYRAGLEDVAHQPHSVYYDRYPRGLESTIWYDQIFVKWKNTIPYGVVVESFVSGSQLTTRLWSTKHFDVQIHQGQPYGFVKAGTEINPAPDCEPSSYSKDGFSVDVGRTVSLHGEVVEDSRHTVNYETLPQVQCQ